VWTRRTSNQNYDLLIYVSNWPEKRSYAWETLLKARAIENQSYVAAVNRVGTDGNSILYSGNSVVINPLGKEILKFRDFEDGMKTQKISLTELQKIRTQLPFFNDVDRFTIQ
jgi:predicted amidohydrolase